MCRILFDEAVDVSFIKKEVLLLLAYLHLQHVKSSCQVFSCCYFFFNKGCIRHGLYGNQCNISCPANCQDKVCHIVNRICHRCEPGWTGQFCTRSKILLRTKYRYLRIWDFSFVFYILNVHVDINAKFKTLS